MKHSIFGAMLRRTVRALMTDRSETVTNLLDIAGKILIIAALWCLALSFILFEC